MSNGQNKSASELWEAFAQGGWGSARELDQTTDLAATGSERMQEFYNWIIGPAFGAEPYDPSEEGFGDVWEDYVGGQAGGQFDTYDFEAAERAFKMAIGDPYVPGADPFAWERVSRMSTDHAQDLLESQLFGHEQGRFLGGEYGTEYSTGISRSLEDYTTSMAEQAKAVTYGQLEGGQALHSGRSGSVLKSGSAVEVSEDALKSAYKKAKGIGEEYFEDKKGLGRELEEDLTTAVDKYLTSMQTEKDQWYNTILEDVIRAKEHDAFDFEGFDPLEDDPVFGTQYMCGINETWDEELGECVAIDNITTIVEELGWEQADEACGPGLVRDESGICTPAEELGLTEDPFGIICSQGEVDECGVCGGAGPEPNHDCEGNCLAEVDECGVCGGDNSACTDECGDVNGQNAAMDDCGVCYGDNECLDCNGVPFGPAELDECGVCGGEGAEYGRDCDGNCTLEVDCMGECGGSAITDECGVCNGSGASFICWDGSTACSEEECSEEPIEEELIEEDPIEEDPIEEEEEDTSIYGCTDSTACNYDPNADTADGSCSYADHQCWDGSVVCNKEECPEEVEETVEEDAYDYIYGCTDSSACNYDPSATSDDGSCYYPEECPGGGQSQCDPNDCPELGYEECDWCIFRQGQEKWIGTGDCDSPPSASAFVCGSVQG